MTRDPIAVAVDAANRVQTSKRRGTLLNAVRHFRHVLSAVRDESLGPVTSDDVRRLQQLCDDVVEHIEVCLPDGTTPEARRLVDAIYEIRALLEDTARGRFHYASTVRHR